jgi:hypothetical protein
MIQITAIVHLIIVRGPVSGIPRATEKVAELPVFTPVAIS